MPNPSPEVSRLLNELAELRRQARDRERLSPRLEQLERALEAVRRDQAAGETATLRAAQDDVEKQLERYRAALRRVHEFEVYLDKIGAAGHGDLIDATPAVAVALRRVTDRKRAVRDLLNQDLPTALVAPISADA